MDPQNPYAPFLLPLLHTLVEERVEVRRFPFRFMFMGREIDDASLLKVRGSGNLYFLLDLCSSLRM
jgi:hypothetical protein